MVHENSVDDAVHKCEFYMKKIMTFYAHILQMALYMDESFSNPRTICLSRYNNMIVPKVLSIHIYVLVHKKTTLTFTRNNVHHNKQTDRMI